MVGFKVHSLIKPYWALSVERPLAAGFVREAGCKKRLLQSVPHLVDLHSASELAFRSCLQEGNNGRLRVVQIMITTATTIVITIMVIAIRIVTMVWVPL